MQESVMVSWSVTAIWFVGISAIIAFACVLVGAALHAVNSMRHRRAFEPMRQTALARLHTLDRWFASEGDIELITGYIKRILTEDDLPDIRVVRDEVRRIRAKTVA